MLLALDIGNTEITLGLFQGDTLQAQWRLTTHPDRTPDEWGGAVGDVLVRAGNSPNEVRAVCLASVAPAVTQSVVSGVARATGRTAVAVDARSPLPVRLDVDEPLSVGADRIVNVLAAVELYREDVIVVDFGTATTFDCITADGRFIGGVIMPGLRTAADQLTRRAAKLPATELKPPPRVIGRRTEECIQAGVLYGAADAVDGMVRRIRAEWPGTGSPRAIATGGLAGIVAPAHRVGRAGTSRPHPAGTSPRRQAPGPLLVSVARRAGYRLLGTRLDYLLHLRPAEWPIIAAHTALGYLLAVGIAGAGRARTSPRHCSASRSGSSASTAARSPSTARSTATKATSPTSAARRRRRGALPRASLGLMLAGQARSARSCRRPTRWRTPAAWCCRCCTRSRRCGSRRWPGPTGSSTWSASAP